MLIPGVACNADRILSHPGFLFCSKDMFSSLAGFSFFDLRTVYFYFSMTLKAQGAARRIVATEPTESAEKKHRALCDEPTEVDTPLPAESPPYKMKR